MNEFKDIRDELGLTQEQFAEKLGVIAASVYSWEKGIKAPRKPRIREMRALLDEHHRVILANAERHADRIVQPLSPSEEIKNAAKMRDKGILTEEEFARFKAALLGQMERDGERKP